MMDKSVEFIEILMLKEAHISLIEYKLPSGLKFVHFQKGDEKAWADIEFSVGEFDSRKKAADFFNKRYLPYTDELERRCLFIENEYGEKIATFTAWWEYAGVRRCPWVSWVAVKPGYQGKGIGKALIYEGMKLLLLIEGDVDSFLKTQTWSYKAINIYMEQGFGIMRGCLEGWNSGDFNKIMSVLKNHLR